MLVQGCGGIPADQSKEGDTEVNVNPLRGTDSQRAGIVFIDSESGRCSGVMLGPQLIATAGHCLARDFALNGSKSGADPMGLSYNVSSGARVSTSGNYQVDLWPDYTNGKDAEDDFAVIRLTNASAWPDTKTSDYAYIYTDTMGAYSRYQAFGYGANGFDGAGRGSLRTGTFALDWYDDHQFHLTMSGARICKGDSGGPATVYDTATSPELHVAGVTSDFDGDPTPGGYCGQDGAFARFSRMSDKVAWLQKITGIPCTQMKSQVTGRSVTRCFPFTTLKRTVYDCRTRAALGPQQTIDLTTGYSNYKCGNRYQEQCVDDGTPDTYYVEACQ